MYSIKLQNASGHTGIEGIDIEKPVIVCSTVTTSH